MTGNEFKAWFKGFSEAIGLEEIPTPNQWKRIQEEVSKMDTIYPGTPVYQPGIRTPTMFDKVGPPTPIYLDKLVKNGTINSNEDLSIF